MQTYYLAVSEDGLLLAIERQARNLRDAVSADCRFDGADIPDYDTIGPVVLTDDEPDDASKIVWRSGAGAWLADEHLCAWKYAVKA